MVLSPKTANRCCAGRGPAGAVAFGFAEPEGEPSEAEGTHPVIAHRASPTGSVPDLSRRGQSDIPPLIKNVYNVDNLFGGPRRFLR